MRDPDPVIFLEHKSLYATKGEVPDGEIVDKLGTAKIVRPGKDATILALALMVPRALAAAEKLKAEHGIDAEVIDVRSLVPLDTQTILGSVAKTHRLFTVEENPRLCGWGAEIVSIVADEALLRSRRPAGAHHHAAYSAAGRRYSGRHRAADAGSDCRDGAEESEFVVHVVTGLVPVTPLRGVCAPPKRDGRDKPGHDNESKGHVSCTTIFSPMFRPTCGSAASGAKHPTTAAST